MNSRVLVVDDDAAVREAVVQTLELADLDPIGFGSFVAAKDLITAGFDGIILSDMRMPGRDGFHLLNYAQGQDPELPVILLTGQGDIPMAVEAMAKGAYGFLEKPCAPDDLLAVISRGLKTRKLVLENRALREMVRSGDAAERMLLGQSDPAMSLRARVRQIAAVEAAVLVQGAAGTGVSKVAEVVHLCSQRSKAPFVKVAAAGLEAVDLSHAITAAATGSLFLDEIGQMPAATQLALAAALDTGQPCRFIAGSTQDLAGAAASGAFNAELYYGLELMPVRIPSLAERPEDIPILFAGYVAQAAEQSGTPAPEITPEKIALLMAQDWPGNARALMSAAMRFVLGLPDELDQSTELGLSEQMARIENALLIAALRRQNGHASEAAKALKLPRKTFYDKLAKYGIRAEEFRR